MHNKTSESAINTLSEVLLYSYRTIHLAHSKIKHYFCSHHLERGRLAGPRPQPKQKHVITDLLYRSAFGN